TPRTDIEMTDIKIWQFGTRWSALRDNKVVPEGDRQEVSHPDPTVLQDRRPQQGGDVATSILAQAYLWSYIFLMLQVRPAGDDLLVIDLWRVPANFSIVCYLAVLLFYYIYLHAYYRLIWEKYYALIEEDHNDKDYFFKYSLFMSLFGMSAMFLSP